MIREVMKERLIKIKKRVVLWVHDMIADLQGKDGVAARVFMLMDTNKDGKVSRAEFLTNFSAACTQVSRLCE